MKNSIHKTNSSAPKPPLPPTPKIKAAFLFGLVLGNPLSKSVQEPLNQKFKMMVESPRISPHANVVKAPHFVQ